MLSKFHWAVALGCCLVLGAAPLQAQEEEWNWAEYGAEFVQLIEQDALENPRLALWTVRNLHAEIEEQADAIELLEAMIPEFSSVSLRQLAQGQLTKLKSGKAPWPMSEDEIEWIIYDLVEADGFSTSVSSGGLTIHLNFRDAIRLVDGSLLEWTAERRRPYVRAALEWLQVLRGVDGVSEYELSIDFISLPVNFCNGFAEIYYEDLRKVGDNWIPAAGMICANSIFYERDTLSFEDWREELYSNALHEMGHLFGVGSLWNLAEWDGEIEPFHPLDLVDSEYFDEEPDRILRNWATWSEQHEGLIYQRPHALAAFQRVHQSDLNFVPISEDAGHLYAIFDEEEGPWHGEDGLLIPSSDDELMAHSHVLSEITVGFLDDLGWEVDYEAAEELLAADEHSKLPQLDHWTPSSLGPLKLKRTGAEVGEELAHIFPKEVDVFGVKVLATADTADQKVLHAAAIMAEYLDNDEDGKVDNQRVIHSLRQHRATLLMTATERDFEQSIDLIMDAVGDDDDIILQNLYGSETHPNGAASGIFDVAYEEVLHLITHAGYSRAYPQAFGEHPGTLLTQAMDVARGGGFQKMPKEYPEGAWYTYYDQTCDYNCQATEYLYWGITTMLGAQDLPGRAEQIDEEWRFTTAAQFKEGDKLLFQLLTDPQYKLPTRLPDGVYMVRD